MYFCDIRMTLSVNHLDLFWDGKIEAIGAVLSEKKINFFFPFIVYVFVDFISNRETFAIKVYLECANSKCYFL